MKLFGLKSLLGIIVVLSASFGGPLSLLAEPVSPASIKKLFEVSKVQELMDQSMANMDQQMMESVRMSLAQVDAPNEEKQKAMDVMSKVVPQSVAKMKSLMSWEKLEPEFTQLYQETFTEEEVKGMLDFYATPAGQAMLNKMPLLMQKTMAMTQKMILPFIQDMNSTMRTEMQKLAASSGGANATN
ncbi:MAG: DUF2059 domain-containing protein [Bdellovibrionales bacterium]|nr:DUF2059 domain-containing protein [Bdellovibrionales bacterium]